MKVSRDNSSSVFTFFSEFLTMVTADDIKDFGQVLNPFEKVVVIVSETTEVNELLMATATKTRQRRR